jgi:hypothetical protein
MVRVLARALSATRVTSSSDRPTAAAPAALKTKKTPAMPRRLCSSPTTEDATSPLPTTCLTAMPSRSDISAAMSKLMRSPL